MYNSASGSMWGHKVSSKKHFEDCNVSPSMDFVKILGRAKFDRLLSLEALFISEINPALNTKDEFRSRTLTLKFI